MEVKGWGWAAERVGRWGGWQRGVRGGRGGHGRGIQDELHRNDQRLECVAIGWLRACGLRGGPPWPTPPASLRPPAAAWWRPVTDSGRERLRDSLGRLQQRASFRSQTTHFPSQNPVTVCGRHGSSQPQFYSSCSVHEASTLPNPAGRGDSSRLPPRGVGCGQRDRPGGHVVSAKLTAP